MHSTPARATGAVALLALLLPHTAQASESCDTDVSWTEVGFLNNLAAYANPVAGQDTCSGTDAAYMALTDDLGALSSYTFSFSFTFTDEAAIDNGFALTTDSDDLFSSDLVLVGVGSAGGSNKMLSIRNPITEVDHALGTAFAPDASETYTVTTSVDGNDVTATIADSSGVIDTVSATVAGTFNDGFLLFGTDNGGESCITDASLGSCVDSGGGSDDGTVTVTFDGETVGERPPVHQEYTEGGFGYYQANSAEGATFFDAGNGDIGIRDYNGDAYGAPLRFYALDGSKFIFKGAEIMNLGSARYPTWVGTHGFSCLDENGTVLASNWTTAAPNATSPESYSSSVFDGVECSQVGVSIMGLTVQDSAITSMTFELVAEDTDGDGVCDATDVVDTDGDGDADDCDTYPDDFDNDGVDTADDCDDTDDTVGLATTWYPDDDSDGFGEDTGGEVVSCTAPSGYVDNADDLCDGDDATGDADLDGVCTDMEECDGDPDKLLAGDCGCGTADEDLDGNGVSDCLDNDLTLEAEQSHVRWFDTKTGKKRIDGTLYTWDKNKSRAHFTGTMELGGGLLAPDFRDATSDDGLGSIQVTMGATNPVTVYDEDLTFDVYDQCNGSTSDNREKWQHTDQYVNSYGKSPYSRERAVLRWRNSMRYRSWNDTALPAMSDTDNLGKVHSRSIAVDESRIRVRWNRKSDLPLTVTLNGVALATIVDNGDNTYSVDSAYTTETVYRGNGTERNRVVDVLYPDNLAEGDVMAWYHDADATTLDNLLYEHTLEEVDGSTSNTDSVWYNAGGRYNIRVPIGDDIVDGSLDPDALEASASEQVVTVSITVGGDTSDSGSSLTGSVTYSGYVLTDGHWRIAETDEDETDGGTQGGSGGSSSGQGGNQSGTTCQTNAADDEE